MQQLSGFANISITGGLLAGAGVAGLKLTADALGECISEAEKLQSVSTTLEIKAFGKDLLDESKLPQIKAQMEELEDTAMNVSLGTVFNAQQIEESMISMIKGGMSREMVGAQGAEANAYFAQINEVDAVSTADATVKFQAGFQLEEDQIKDSLDLITRYADASIANALAIQQNIGNVAGSAMSVWKDRDNMQVAEETIQLVAATKYISGDEASAATMTRNFLDEAGKTYNTMTDRQVGAMVDAGWLKDPVFENGEMTDAQSVFIDYDTGMLKSAAELEQILEETAEKMDAVDFNNLLDTVFGDRGKKTAQALAQKGGATDLSTLKTNAYNQLGIDEQVARQMETAAAQVGIFEESMNTLKSTLGKPFLEGKAAIFKTFNNILAQTTIYFKEHPEVTKFMVAIAGGVSGLLLVTGIIMTLVGVVGSLKLVFSIAGPQIAAFFTPVLPVLATVIAVVMVIAGIAFVIYKNWSVLKPQFEALFSSLSGFLKVVGNGFKSFGQKAISALREVWTIFEGATLWIINTAVPLISGGLSFIVQILTGNFRSAWESMSPLARILTLILAPSIIVVTGALLIMTATALANQAVILGTAIATNVAGAAVAIWHGIVAAATFIQTAWNFAMNGGTAATIAQKIAVAALYPIMLVVKGASLLWTGIQWALNAAMMAFPGTWIIMIILAVIGIVMLGIKYFKEICDWIVGAWDKLKGFLGFKKDAKEELEDPINVTVNENGEGQVIPVTQETEQISPIQQVQQVAQQTVQLNPTVQGTDVSQMVQQSVGTTQISVEIIPYIINLRNSGMSDEEIKQNLGLPEDYQIPVDLQVTGTGNEQIDQIMQQYENGATFTPQVDLSQAQEQLTGFTGDMNVLGADGTNQFAQGLSGSDALGTLGTSVNTINSTITNGLIKDEEMKTYGSNLVQSFIDGINAKSAALQVAVQAISTVIGDYLAVHSPTKKGSLHTNQLWGGNLIQSFIHGMDDKDFQLSTAVSSVAQKLGGINELKYAGNLFHDMKNLEELQAERYFSRSKDNTTKNFSDSSSADYRESEKGSAPIYIMIQGADKNQEEIAKAVAKELEKQGLGRRKKSSDFSLTMSPYGFRMGY